jgi:hypothetical protein
VLAQTKRRRISLLSLPVVVITGFLLVARLAAWQRSDLIAELADCVAHGEASEARDAVRKLAAMPNAPISVLVTAAAADEHETAETAQLAINRMLGRWQRDIEARQRVGAVADKLSELAQSLAERHSEFSESDYAWLASTAGRIVRLANKFPPKKTPLVAIHCDVIIAAVGDHGLTTSASATPVAANQGAATSNIGPRSAAPPAAANDPNSTASVQQEFSTHAPQPFPESGEVSAPLKKEQTRDSSTPFKPAAPESSELFTDPGSPPIGVKDDRQPAIDPPSERESLRPDPSGRAALSRPMFRVLPSAPADIRPIDRNESATDELKPGWDIKSYDSLGQVGSRELLRYWLVQESANAVILRGTAVVSRTFSPPAVIGIAIAGLPIETEMARRGFGRLTLGIVRPFFSASPDERMHLVDYVLARPGTGAGAWLLLLADDMDAEVRLFAVTLMATSNDAILMEKAWQVAIRDRDPRIADLANRLRERRAGALRR